MHDIVSFTCSWCAEIVEGVPILGKTIVISKGRAHYLRPARPARFERPEETNEDLEIAA